MSTYRKVIAVTPIEGATVKRYNRDGFSIDVRFTFEDATNAASYIFSRLKKTVMARVAAAQRSAEQGALSAETDGNGTVTATCERFSTFG